MNLPGSANTLWVGSRIVRLLFRCCPMTIGRLVVPIVIDAIQRLSFRAISHVCKEVDKRVTPAVTDRNAAPAIRFISIVLWITATLNHMSPRLILRTWIQSMAMAGAKAHHQQWIATTPPFGSVQVVVKQAKATTLYRKVRAPFPFTLWPNRLRAMVRVNVTMFHPSPLVHAAHTMPRRNPPAISNTTNGPDGIFEGHREPSLSGVMRLGVLIAGAAFILLLSPNQASAQHLIYLPYAGQTWMAQQIKANQEQVWCVDSRAETYANFISQLRDVNDQYTQRVGIKHRQVPFDDASCQVRHVMLPEFPCGAGAAACIYYANVPVVVHYQETLGYTDWRSTQAHELGHGILGQLHEQYQDSGGTIQCLYRPETEMSCGPPYVRYPQPLDVSRGCAIIATSWCGQAPAQTFPWWDGARWRFADGWSWDPSGFGVWYDPQGSAIWGQCIQADHDCWHIPGNRWVFKGSLLFNPATGIFESPPVQ